MPNTYFRFRQFTVHQERSAMKVCTDSCLFGAWLSNIFENCGGHILDIGAGTGLLSLMLAQKTGARIDAVEVDREAFEQAAENFSASPWSRNLHVYLTPIQQYSTPVRYSLIVSNPPFYAHDLRSENDRRNAAMHDASLTLEELMDAAGKFKTADAQFAALITFRRASGFEELYTRYGWYARRKVTVKQTYMHPPFRCMYLLTRTPCENSAEEIVIRKDNNQYTEQFYALLKDYYLFEKYTEYESDGRGHKK